MAAIVGLLRRNQLVSFVVLGRTIHWRVGQVWYAVVLLLPVAVTLAAAGINLELGEEPGWRGFALPRLLVGHSALIAALILGVIHMVWHLPLFGVEYAWTNVWPEQSPSFAIRLCSPGYTCTRAAACYSPCSCTRR